MVDFLGPGAFGCARPAASRPTHTPANGAGDPPSWFQDCSSPLARDGTEWRAAPLNFMIANDRSLVAGSGLTADNLDNAIIAKAIQSGGMNYAVASGTANNWTVALNLALTSYRAGRVLWLKAPATNTNATVVVSIDGLADRPVKKADGSSPAVGDLVAGRWYATIDDGASICVVSTLPSDSLFADIPINALPFPDVYTDDHLVALTVGSKTGAGGFVTVTGGELLQCGESTGGGLGRIRRIKLPAADFGNANANTLAANAIHYLRGHFVGGVFTLYLQRGADTDAAPVGGLGTPGAASGGGFESNTVDILLAKIVTGANGSNPTLIRLANALRLVAYGEKQSPTLGVTTSWVSGNDSVTVNANAYVRGLFEFVLNWARKPVVRIPSGFVWVQNAAQVQYLSATSNVSTIDVYDRFKIVGKVESDYVDGQAWVTGTLQWSAWFVGMRVLAEA